jgi:hypothetical protein
MGSWMGSDPVSGLELKDKRTGALGNREPDLTPRMTPRMTPRTDLTPRTAFTRGYGLVTRHTAKRRVVSKASTVSLPPPPLR